MKTFDDYISMLHFLLDKKIYRYYITYEYDMEYYIQISYYKPKRLDDPDIQDKFEVLNIIKNYDQLERIITDDNFVNVDVKIDNFIF